MSRQLPSTDPASRAAGTAAARWCLPALASLWLATACAGPTPNERLATLYQRSLDDAKSPGPTAPAKIEARAREARQLAEGGSLEHTQDMLVAAQLLYESRTLENVTLARELALHAVELGDARGLPIAAEAEDVELMIRGMPQRYGTQYVFDPESGRWSLYPVNPRTSDTERAAMGIVPLEEARLREAILNERVPKLPQPERAR